MQNYTVGSGGVGFCPKKENKIKMAIALTLVSLCWIHVVLCITHDFNFSFIISFYFNFIFDLWVYF